MAEQPEAFVEGVEAARLPGLEQAGQGHTRLGALGAAQAATDLADHHQRANASLRQVVVRTQACDQHELEQLVFVAQQALGQRLAGVLFGTGKFQAQSVGPRCQRDILLLARVQCGLRVLTQLTLGIVIQRPYIRCPRQHRGISRVGLLQRVQIAQQMHPAALMLARIAVVAAVAIAHQVARELPTQDAPNHMLSAARVIFIGAYGVLAGGANGPDVAILAVLAPPRLVAVQDGTGARLLFERIEVTLERAAHLMQQFDDFARAACAGRLESAAPARTAPARGRQSGWQCARRCAPARRPAPSGRASGGASAGRRDTSA